VTAAALRQSPAAAAPAAGTPSRSDPTGDPVESGAAGDAPVLVDNAPREEMALRVEPPSVPPPRPRQQDMAWY